MTTLTVEFGKLQQVRRAIAVGQVAARADDDGVVYWLDRYANEAYPAASGDRRDGGAPTNRTRPKTSTPGQELRRTS